MARAEVGSQQDVGVEHGHEGVEVAGPSSREEGIHDRTLASGIALGGCGLGALDPATGSARQLPRCLRSAAHHGPDLVEGQVEHVVEHEGQALWGREGVEHDLEGEADRVGQERLLFGVR